MNESLYSFEMYDIRLGAELKAIVQVEFLLILSKCNQDPEPAVSETSSDYLMLFDGYTHLFIQVKIVFFLIFKILFPV